MKKILIILLFCSQVFSVGEAGAVFLLIAPGAGPVATGEAQVAKADDVYAGYYNPAGLGYLSGSELGMMHVNWLPNLADDIYYDFLAYRYSMPGVGTLGANLIYLNLGEQDMTDAEGNFLQKFRSNMWALTTAFGTQVTKRTSLGLGFKVIQQNLAPTGAGSEITKGSATNILFDVGYLSKFITSPSSIYFTEFNFGLSISNIGPKIWFKDKAQADPAPTNMKFGIYTTLYNDTFNKISVLVDANKQLVARYPAMDWNGDGVISGYDEKEHSDPWYTALYSAWLDDWYYGGDLDSDGDGYIGGYTCDGSVTFENGSYYCNGSADGFINNQEIDSETGVVTNFNDPDYGIYSGVDQYTGKVELEKGSGDSRKFKTELEEMVYNFGIEYWYSNIFVLRGGYIYDYEGKVMNPTFGAGLRFGQYGFDFGYTAGEQGHPRANTMFFSINIGV